MKKLLFLTFFVPQIAFSLVTPNTIWEFQADATAGNVNGCGFDPSLGGNDYSQQSAAQVSYTDLVLGAGGNTVTSAASPFTTTLAGNVLHITGGTGFTAGWYTIKSVDGSNVATLMNSAGTAGSTGGTGNVGGACSLNSTLDDDVFETFAASNTAWIKYGLYNLGETVSISTDANFAQTVKIYGYNTTRGDLTFKSLNEAFSIGMPTISAAANSFIIQGDYWALTSLNLTGTATASNFATFGTGNILRNITSNNTSSTANREAGRLGNLDKVLNSDFQAVNGFGLSMNLSNNIVIGSFIHDSTNCVSLVNQDGNIFIDNIFAVCTATAITMTGTAVNNVFYRNTIISSATATNGRLLWGTFGNTGTVYVGNLWYGSKFGIGSSDTFDSTLFFNNNFYANDVYASSGAIIDASNTFIDPQFANPLLDDFRPSTTLKNTLYPFKYGNSPTTSQSYIGAVQPVETTGALYLK